MRYASALEFDRQDAKGSLKNRESDTSGFIKSGVGLVCSYNLDAIGRRLEELEGDGDFL